LDLSGKFINLHVGQTRKALPCSGIEKSKPAVKIGSACLFVNDYFVIVMEPNRIFLSGKH
jgi:hypothetical protein